MLKTFKYRLYPSKAQAELINKHCGCARFIYNFGLNAKIETYQKEKKSLTCIDIGNLLPDLKKQNIWLKEVNSQSLQMSLRNLDNAYQKFFREKKGFPKFKSKKDNKQSFQIPQHSNIDFSNNLLFIPKFKKGIKIVLHRKFEGKIKTITISKTCTNKYFASILVDTTDIIPNKTPISENKAIGIDLGIKHFATLSNGIKIENPKHLKKSLTRLKTLQQRLSKKVKGSNNRNKARLKVAKQYEKVTNQRNDFLHKLSTSLLNQYDTLCLETLSVKDLIERKELSQAISDCSWSNFNSMLEYKANWYGKNILRLGRFEPSSKICSCGIINNELTLSDRKWTCKACGLTHDRDILASCNILKYCFHKQNIIGLEQPEFMPSVMTFSHS